MRDCRRQMVIVGLALAHAIGYAVLSVACVVLAVNTAKDPEAASEGYEDMIQAGLLAAAFALLAVLAGWGLARAAGGGGSWQLTLAGAVAAVGGTGYALDAVRELTDPGYAHDGFLGMFFGVSAAVGLMGGVLVGLTRRGRSAAG